MDGNIIQSRRETLFGDVTLDRNISINLEAGYDYNYSTVSDSTKLKGDMIINNGMLKIESGMLVIE